MNVGYDGQNDNWNNDNNITALATREGIIEHLNSESNNTWQPLTRKWVKSVDNNPDQHDGNLKFYFQVDENRSDDDKNGVNNELLINI